MRHSLKIFLPAVAASLLIAACGSSSSKSTTSSSSASGTPAATQSSGASTGAATVKSASSSLGTILVNSQGMTLYHLSGEQNGKFICKGSCVSVWHPLIASSSATPSGEVGSLGTVKRPEGTLQVTYKGTPLYTFAQDKAAGETNGQGFKDVGTWSVVTTGSSAAPSSSSSGASGSESSSGGGESGGGYKY